MLRLLPSLLPNAPSSLLHYVPPVSYNIDRPFLWPWFSVCAYGFMFLATAILIPVNWALQGYQVVVKYEQDPNITNPLWFHRFTGYPEPGDLCSPHLFSKGDTFSTNRGQFVYTMDSISSNDTDAEGATKDSLKTALPYKGQPLYSCFFKSVSVDLDDVKVTVSGVATLQCSLNDEYTFSATTTNIQSGTQIDFIYNIAEQDMFNQWKSLRSLGHVIPDTISGSSTTGASFAYEPDATQPGDPPLNSSAIYVTGPMFNLSEDAYKLMQPSVNNILQFMAAAVLLDTNFPSPNNILTNTYAVVEANNTLLNPFIGLDTSRQYSPVETDSLVWELDAMLVQDYWPGASIFDPNSYNVTPVIDTTYECHITEAKSPGSAAVSVLVSTLSIGSSIWTVLIMIASYFAKRNKPEANYCQCHDSGDGVFRPLPMSSESDIELGVMETAPVSAANLVPKIPSEDRGDASEMQPLDPPS